jgi:hypothetical protein
MTSGKHTLSSPSAVAALLLLLATVGLGTAALPVPPPEPLPIEQMRPKLTGLNFKQVEQLLGAPRRSARQILYQRYFEQWVYDAPLNLCIEFECRRGQEAQVQSVRSTAAGRP